MLSVECSSASKIHIVIHTTVGQHAGDGERLARLQTGGAPTYFAAEPGFTLQRQPPDAVQTKRRGPFRRGADNADQVHVYADFLPAADAA